ncbi:ABC transporter ATP-binding protein [Escherichia coli]|nr:ABC transporter ATP-binding protein [Escherichia coli]
MNFIEKYIITFNKCKLFFIILLSTISSFLFVLFGYLIKTVIDNKESIGEANSLLIFIVCFLAIRFLMPAGYSISEYLTQKTNIELSVKLREQVIDNILNSHQEHFLRKNKGELNKVIESMLSSASSLFYTICSDVVPLLIQMIGIIITICMSVNSLIAIEFIIIMTIYVIFVIRMTQRRFPMMKSVALSSKFASGRMFDMMHMYPMDKAFHTTDKSRERVIQAVNAHSDKQRKVNNEFFLFGISSAFLSVVFSSLIILSAYWMLLQGRASYGSIVMLATFLFQVFLPLNRIGYLFRQIKMARTEIDLYCTEMNDIKKITNTNKEYLHVKDHICNIEISNKSFSHNIPLTKGIVTFITGENGSGKTTIAKILSGNTSSHKSNIKINNIQQNKTNTPFVNVLYVPQDIDLIPGTIEENILHYSDINNLNIVKNLLHRFKFDKPLDYTIRGYGHNLSGGQKQKLGVSLTSGKNVDLIIFDEPTKGFDSIGVKTISDYIKEESKEKHIIIISHDERLINNMPNAHIIDIEKHEALK